MPSNENIREITNREKREIKKLVVVWCANYDKAEKECLPLETDCYMFTKYFTCGFCRYFQKTVLPLNPVLESMLLGISILPEKTCCLCSKPYIPKTNRQRYCTSKCSQQAERENSRKRMTKMRKRKVGNVTK